MELEYELNIQDIINFNISYMKISKTSRSNLIRIKVLIPLIYILCGILFLYINKFNHTGLIYFFVFLLISILWFIFYPKYMIIQIRNNIKKLLSEQKNTGMTGKQRLILKENSLFEINERSKIEHTGKFLNKVCEDDKYYFLFLTSITALIVPKILFENNENKKKEFLNLIENYIIK